jgi:hypothetical protein
MAVGAGVGVADGAGVGEGVGAGVEPGDGIAGDSSAGVRLGSGLVADALGAAETGTDGDPGPVVVGSTLHAATSRAANSSDVTRTQSPSQ